MIFYVLAALMGALVKLVDQLEDVFKNPGKLKFLFAILYGLIGGYLISYSTFSSLWIAALFAQLLAGRLDRPTHILGFSLSLLFASFFGIADFRLFDVFVLFMAAFVDEANPLKWNPALRPALKLAALAYVFVGRWDYFIAIMLFDLAYLAMSLIIPEKKKLS